MKREVSLCKDRRGAINAKNLIAFYHSLGWIDEQIKKEMLRLKEDHAKQDKKGLDHEHQRSD